MAIDQTPLATARRVLDDDPSLAAFIVSKSDAAQADDDLARLASLYARNGCTRAEALELIEDAERWQAEQPDDERNKPAAASPHLTWKEAE